MVFGVVQDFSSQHYAVFSLQSLMSCLFFSLLSGFYVLFLVCVPVLFPLLWCYVVS